MLKPDPNKRMSITDCLKHHWFKSFPIRCSPSLDQLSIYLKNIISFKTDPKYFFQHATLAYMIHHITKKEETDEIRNLFIYLDQKGDGKLTYHEIITGFKKCKNFNERDLYKVLKFIDVSKGGHIEYEEFVRACVNKVSLLTEENLKTAFLLFTKDESKLYISPMEFKGILGLQTKFSDKMWEGIIKEIDANGDGQIEYDEFKDMMLKFTGE
jgi:calcium-dependent protein kinase